MIQSNLNYFYFEGQSSKEAEVKVVATQDSSSRVLLDRWACPSSEFACWPIFKARLSVVVGIPKRIFGIFLAAVSVSHDLVPHISTCVNPYSSSSTLDGCDELLDVITVAFWSSQGPTAS